MNHPDQPLVWRAFGRSVRGASHRRRASPNQDSIGWSPAAACGPNVAVAVADGHGSAACCRSDAGSDMAVRTAIGLLEEFLARRAEEDGALARVAESWVPREMELRWRQAVSAHLAGQPFSAAELARIRGSATAEQAKEPWIAYGSTILSVLATSEFVLYVQLGDGDILIVSEDGAVSRPWPVDQRLLGVETTSLCSSSSRSDMRVLLQEITGPPPELILLATDGYKNSFREEKGFLQIGGDVLEMIREDGVDSVESSLEGWLTEASELGSGDDITLGVLCRARGGAANDGA